MSLKCGPRTSEGWKPLLYIMGEEYRLLSFRYCTVQCKPWMWVVYRECCLTEQRNVRFCSFCCGHENTVSHDLRAVIKPRSGDKASLLRVSLLSARNYLRKREVRTFTGTVNNATLRSVRLNKILLHFQGHTFCDCGAVCGSSLRLICKKDRFQISTGLTTLS
jgi:hypothetical protein